MRKAQTDAMAVRTAKRVEVLQRAGQIALSPPSYEALGSSSSLVTGGSSLFTSLMVKRNITHPASADERWSCKVLLALSIVLWSLSPSQCMQTASADEHWFFCASKWLRV